MISEDQNFVIGVVVINSTQKIVIMTVISWLANVITKLSAIAKICKYKRFHEGHHFIPMAMEVHNTLGRDMDHFIKECACLFHDRWWEVIILVFLHSILQATC